MKCAICIRISTHETTDGAVFSATAAAVVGHRPTDRPSLPQCWSQTTTVASCAIFCTLACRFIVMENHSQFTPTKCKCNRPATRRHRQPNRLLNVGAKIEVRNARVSQDCSTTVEYFDTSPQLLIFSFHCLPVVVLSYWISTLMAAVGDRVFHCGTSSMLPLLSYLRSNRQECINKSCNYFPTQSANSINNFCTYFTASTRKPRRGLV